MGLGKTAQSIAALECLRKVASVKGPFLIVAPLTTLPHWQVGLIVLAMSPYHPVP